jgi:outer membrane lipoprotein-sorting protein
MILALLLVLQRNSHSLSLQEPAEALRALAERMKDARTLSCAVKQTRKTALMEKPLVSSGTMLYRREPGRLVFRLTEPRATEIHMDRATYQVHRPDEKRLERVEFEDDALTSQLLTLFEPKPETMGKAFRMSKSGPDILLEPLDEKVKKRLASIALTLDGPELRRIRYTQADGDDVSFEMSDVRLNPDLEPDAFELKVPEGTRVLTHRVGR